MAFLKPKEGYVIIDPDNLRKLPAEGAEVVINNFYFKRILDGDVYVVEPEVITEVVAAETMTVNIDTPTTT